MAKKKTEKTPDPEAEALGKILKRGEKDAG